MWIKIINSCQKNHKLNAEKIVRHILEKIPNKFLIGLSEVHIFDAREENEPDIKYRPKSRISKDPVIEINMENIALNGMPFFSILTLNVMFLFAINDHIEIYVRHCSEDKEILSYPTGRVNYHWMYLGVWSPLLIIFTLVNYVISKTSLSRKIPRYFIDHTHKD